MEQKRVHITAKPVGDAEAYKIMVEPCDMGVRICIYDVQARMGTYIDISPSVAREHIKKIEQILA